MKGLKIRSRRKMQLEATMEALGAQVTKIAFPELYLAPFARRGEGQGIHAGDPFAERCGKCKSNIALTEPFLQQQPSLVMKANAKFEHPMTDRSEKIVLRRERRPQAR